MKKIYLVLVFAIFMAFSCNDNDNAVASDVAGDGQGGSLATFTLKGDYLYTVDFFNLSVFNISDATNPVKVNTVNVGFNIETLFIFKEYLFIGSQDAMYIYDIANAELPKLLSRSNHFRACDPVVANDTNAYVTLHSNATCGGAINELKTYNIEDVENPVLLNTRGLTEPKGLSLFADNYLLVCDDTVKIFDVSDPKNSKYINEIDTNGAIDIIIRNNHAFVVSEVAINQYQLNENDITDIIQISTFTF
jgi:hypothetical protein